VAELGKVVGKIDWLPRARLLSGLVLFAYVASHLLNHALGIVSLDAMEAGRVVFLGLWRNPAGTVALYGAVLVHIVLVLYSLYRRRRMRLNRWEILQALFGLALPPLLALHLAATRGLNEFFGVEDSYAYVLAAIYVFDPMQGLKQAATVLVAWGHGVIGMTHWLRLKPWYPRWQPLLAALALLLPVLALAGFVSAGHEVELRLADPAWAEALAARTKGPTAEAGAWALSARDGIVAGTLLLLLLLFAGRFLRGLIEKRRGLVAISYPDRRQVTITPGMTVLEASRSAGIPHASVCGGRGRCSTCRVLLGDGGTSLPAPSAEESRVLARVGAPPGVRLACQIRPHADLEVTPLLPPGVQPREAYGRPRRLSGTEREIAVLFADLRAFTRFAENKLPFDVVFALNQYFRAMGAAIEQAGGRVDKFIGDGVMALFGLETAPDQACRQALAAARGMAAGMDELNRLLRNDLEDPLRIGIGIHIGTVIVGEMGYAEAMSVTAIGDAVNTASRLEDMTKELGGQLVVSESVARRAGVDLSGFANREIEVRGRSEPLTVYVVPNARDLPAG
jgi:adenylate cyclase